MNKLEGLIKVGVLLTLGIWILNTKVQAQSSTGTSKPVPLNQNIQSGSPEPQFLSIPSSNIATSKAPEILPTPSSFMAGAAPAHDVICGALTYSTCTIDSTANATADYYYGCSSGSKTIWYKFQLSGGYNAAQITVTNISANDPLSSMLFGGTCSSPTGIGSACGDTIIKNYTELDSLTDYFVGIGTNSSDSGKFELCITPYFDSCAINRPGNDSICNAYALALDGSCMSSQTTQCATPDYAFGCATSETKTVFYELNLTGSNTELSIDLSNNTFPNNSATVGVFMSEDCANLIGYIYYECTDLSTPIELVNLDTTKTYFLIVGSEPGKEGTFDVCATEGANKCDTITSPSNQEPCSAPAISNDTCIVGQSNICASTATWSFGCMNGGDKNVYYKVDLQDSMNTLYISFSNYSFPSDVNIALFTGPTCDSINSGARSFCGTPAETFEFGRLKDSITYWVSISTPYANTGDFDICLSQDRVFGALTGDEQECQYGLTLCDSMYSIPASYMGYGNSEEVGSSTCLGAGETNSVWFRFTAKESGAFGFEIDAGKDYDFSLYDISSNGCSGVSWETPIRCNFSGTFGATGIDQNNTSTGNLSESATGNSFMDGIDITAGQEFALVVDNWTGNNDGFTIQFHGASVYDVIVPDMDYINNLCDTSFEVVLTSSVLCDSIDINDFVLTDTTGGTDYTSNLVSATGVNCTGASTGTIKITYSGLSFGTYKLSTKSSGIKTSNSCGTALMSNSNIVFDLISETESQQFFTSCDSISVNSNWYYNDTVVRDTFSTSSCDSIVISNISIFDPANVLGGYAYLDSNLVTKGVVELFKTSFTPFTATKVDEDSLDSNGMYSFHNVAKGTYIVKITPDPDMYPNAVPTYYEKGFPWTFATNIPVSGCEDTITNYNVTIESFNNGTGSGAVNGKVVNSGNKSLVDVSNLDVYLTDQSGNQYSGYTRTATDGSFSFENLDNATYNIGVEVMGFSISTKNEFIIDDQNNALEVEICLDSIDYEVVLCMVNSINELKIGNTTINMYPNPSSGTVVLETSETLEQIIIHDISGKEVYRLENISKGKTLLNSERSLKKGFYFVNIQLSNNEKISKKLIILE